MDSHESICGGRDYRGCGAAADRPTACGFRFLFFFTFLRKVKKCRGNAIDKCDFFLRKKSRLAAIFGILLFIFSKRGERVFPSEKPFWPSVKISFALNIYALAKTYGFGLCILGLNSFWPKNLRFFGTCARVGLALEGSSRHAPWPGPKDQGKHRP